MSRTILISNRWWPKKHRSLAMSMPCAPVVEGESVYWGAKFSDDECGNDRAQSPAGIWATSVLQECNTVVRETPRLMIHLMQLCLR